MTGDLSQVDPRILSAAAKAGEQVRDLWSAIHRLPDQPINIEIHFKPPWAFRGEGKFFCAVIEPAVYQVAASRISARFRLRKPHSNNVYIFDELVAVYYLGSETPNIGWFLHAKDDKGQEHLIEVSILLAGPSDLLDK